MISWDARVGDLAALLSDFARIQPDMWGHVLRGYRAAVKADGADLEAAFSTVIRHHVLTLLERIRLWQDFPDRRQDLIDPVGYWLHSLRLAVRVDREGWVADVMRRSR